MSTVDHPAHYNQGGIEVIEVLKAYMTIDELIGFCKGNVLKYMLRAKHKGRVEDYRKAAWYQDYLIKLIDEAQQS